ncbi:DUF4245 domain-containing protein [Tessaracoccus caeni]|uniref:DUF4245 domain-containing protein n=1 Tax=Tessaracoccus caeni TaxID=3031239 RepID=UPI0023DA0BA3|nr:DUF4245 domain-containing protein [Tessaracoccus caeni]MDF1489123.1 DUF4245 domain-containing protein [Tessaracoccus caeni]
MAAPHGMKGNSRDMVISMVVLIVPVLLITWFFTRTPAPEVETVDVAPVLAQAQEESPYPVLRPAGLPADWQPVRAAWAADGERWITGEPAVGNSWQLGYMAPNDIYVGLQQRDRAIPSFITWVTREGLKEEGSLDAAGLTWDRYVSHDGRTRSLIAETDDVVAAITGDTDYTQLEAFATTLTSQAAD